MNTKNTGITLTFAELQAFINYVVDNTLIYGMGYRDILILYCVAKFYGKVEFNSDDVASIYDNEYDKLFSAYDINSQQFEMIKRAIDNELDRRIKLLSANMVMSEANDAIANLANKIATVVDSISKNSNAFSADDVKKIANAMSSLKGNVTSDSLIKAMVDNGVIKGKNTAKKTAKTMKLDVSKGRS